jgi:hypothetical protein
MGPSNADKAEMARLLQIMNGGNGGGTNVPAVQQPQQGQYSGGYAGTQRPLHESRQAPPAQPYMPSYGTSREEVDAMKNLLEKMNALGGDEVSAPRQTQPLIESSQFTSAPKGNGPFTVLATIQESNGKEVNRYSVVDASRQDVVGDLVIKESATAIMKLMNKGHDLSSSKVQEVLELEEDFNRNRIETGRHKARYQRSMELGETAAANVFKDRFNAAKANALVAQDTIKSINESLR